MINAQALKPRADHGEHAFRSTRSGRSDRVEDHELDEDIADLFGDDEADSVARARWKDRLSEYVDRQGSLDALRLRSPTEPPWPATDNPMLGFLSERTAEIAADDGLGVALAWLARNAWFEGAISERARIARLIDED